MNVTFLVLHHAKDVNRQGRQPRVAESDQLAATASMNIVLRYRDLHGTNRQPKRREVTLYCTGRGEFANKTVTLISRSPLDYRIVQDRRYAKVPEVALNVEEQKVVNYLKGRPKTSAQISSILSNQTDEHLRSIITGLRTKGVIRKVNSKTWPPRYRLVEPNYQSKNEDKEKQSQ